ncbi:MAG: hypothetical protein CL797_02135 [Chromatiales bacterium]|jgi:uncharacterized protein (DUF924 family)|nr:hypothetical protein [Chromatiales bacterium]MDP6435700.1 DUF924 family protein [Gammaproteobacteria bacterium]
MASPEEILQFWFSDSCDSPELAEKRNSFWFSVDDEVDQQIWTNYADLVVDAGGDHYRYWTESAYGQLALIIVLDQFPRNIFRGTSEAYRYDGAALSLASEGVKKGQLAGLAIPQQAFFLMPYQHSEDIAVQRTGLELMQGLVNEAPDGWQNCASTFLDFARLHHDIVASYGRFPHRNAVVGRTSTEAETRYLAEGGQTFGQAG